MAQLERERLSWAEFGEATRVLARQVVDDGFDPDLVLSVARGGLLVGAALGYALDVKNTWTMNVEFYTGVDERLDVPMILPPPLRSSLISSRRGCSSPTTSRTPARRSSSSRTSVPGRSRRSAAPCSTRSLSRASAASRLAAHRPLDRLPVERVGLGHDGARVTAGFSGSSSQRIALFAMYSRMRARSDSSRTTWS